MHSTAEVLTAGAVVESLFSSSNRGPFMGNSLTVCVYQEWIKAFIDRDQNGSTISMHSHWSLLNEFLDAIFVYNGAAGCNWRCYMQCGRFI